MEQKLLEALIDAGIGGAIAAFVIFLAYKLISRLAVNVGMKMVAAFESQAEAISRQANSMEGLTTSIKDFVTRDSNEHQDMMILLRVIIDRLERGYRANEQ